MTRPTRVELCCADHDHSLGADAVDFKTGEPIPCIHGVKEAIIELTDAEIADMEAMAAQAAEERAAREAEEARIAGVKASARQKLVAGQPLTEEEASFLVV